MKLGIVNKKTDIDIKDYKNDFRLIKEAGFDSIDLQNFVKLSSPLYILNDSEFKETLESIKEEAINLDLSINQLHTYWECPPIMDFTKEGMVDEVIYYEKAIKAAHILGTKYVVIHHRFPFGLDKKINDLKEEEFKRINIEFLKSLEKCTKDNDVILCLENLPMDFRYTKVDGTLDIINEINSDYIKMCLDTGHANVFNDDIYEDIIKIGDKLACLHIHDNMYGKDLHLMPYMGTVDWDKFIKGLKEINYQGVLSFELSPEDKLDDNIRLSGLKYICEIGNSLRDKII